MKDVRDIPRELHIMHFRGVVDDRRISDLRYMFKDKRVNYSKLIHPDYRKFDVLSVAQIAKIFIENGDKITHIFSSNKLENYERLLCFKDETESKLISHLIDIKVAVETLFEKFQDAVRMRADVTEVIMLLRKIDRYQTESDDDICKNCSSAISVGCYFDIFTDPLIIISEKQILEPEFLVETAKILLQGNSKINNLCDSGYTPLVKAAMFTELGLFLIENGAHVNVINTKGECRQPLYFAVENCESISLVEKMIEKGADLDALDDGYLGSTALHKACYFVNENAIELLIRKGADITLRDSDGQTPFAFIENNSKAAHLLILFIKEIAKAKFEDRKVSSEDLKIIKNDPYLKGLYNKCRDQLDKLKSTIFYPPFSYIDVLNMRNKSVKKLVNLIRNENFIHKMAVNLSAYSFYNKDLMINFVEAEITMRKYDKLESILKSALGNYIPTDMIKYIVDFIEVQDLCEF